MGCFGAREDNPKKDGVCPKCGADVDEDGGALEICAYSPVICKHCGWAPCDESC